MATQAGKLNLFKFLGVIYIKFHVDQIQLDMLVLLGEVTVHKSCTSSILSAIRYFPKVCVLVNVLTCKHVLVPCLCTAAVELRNTTFGRTQVLGEFNFDIMKRQLRILNVHLLSICLPSSSALLTLQLQESLVCRAS